MKFQISNDKKDLKNSSIILGDHPRQGINKSFIYTDNQIMVIT